MSGFYVFISSEKSDPQVRLLNAIVYPTNPPKAQLSLIMKIKIRSATILKIMLFIVHSERLNLFFQPKLNAEIILCIKM